MRFSAFEAPAVSTFPRRRVRVIPSRAAIGQSQTAETRILAPGHGRYRPALASTSRALASPPFPPT